MGPRRLFVIIVGVLLLVACGSDSGDETTTTDEGATTTEAGVTTTESDGTPETSAPEGSETGEPIKIGASLALTGDFSPDSQLVRDGYQVWVDAINDQGGIDVAGTLRPVELVVLDDGSDREQAVRLVERLIVEEEVDLLLAPWGSGNTSAVAPIAERYQVPMIAPLAASVDIWEQGYEYLFGILPRGDTAFWPVVDLAIEQGAESIAVVSPNDAFPLVGAEGAVARANELGLEVVAEEIYPPGTVDLGSLITRLQDADPDVILNTADANDAILFVRQLRERDYMPQALVLSGATALPEFHDALGPDAENIMGLTYWSAELPFSDPLFGNASEFATTFEEAYGYAPTHDVVASETAGYVFQRAIEEAGSVEAQAVLDALKAFDEETIFGQVRFDEGGSNAGNFSYVNQILDGENVIIYPEDAASTDPVYPHPDAGE